MPPQIAESLKPEALEQLHGAKLRASLPTFLPYLGLPQRRPSFWGKVNSGARFARNVGINEFLKLQPSDDSSVRGHLAEKLKLWRSRGWFCVQRDAPAKAARDRRCEVPLQAVRAQGYRRHLKHPKRSRGSRQGHLPTRSTFCVPPPRPWRDRCATGNIHRAVDRCRKWLGRLVGAQGLEPWTR